MLNDVAANFAEELRRLRTDLGLTQAFVARALEDHGGERVTPQAISNWERGADRPTRDNAAALEQVLDTAPGHLASMLGFSADEERHQGIERRFTQLESAIENLRQLVQQLLDEPPARPPRGR